MAEFDLNGYLSDSLGFPVHGDVTLTSMAGAGGAHSDMQMVTLPDGRQYVMKQTQNLESAKMYGTTREADFYSSNTEEGASYLPRIYSSSCNKETGEMRILMEKLEGVQLGLCFGRGSPLNWDAQLSTEISSQEACLLAFRGVASLHSKYWNKREQLTQLQWLRGSDFLDGRNEQAFMALQGHSMALWKGDERARSSWDPYLVDLLDASFSRVSWSSFQSELASRPVTLRHGDFHPGNAWRRTDGSLALFDWEMVAAGSGPQDLGQWVISHMAPEERRAAEGALLGAYLEELAVPHYSMQQLTAEYAMGGVCHWLWMLPILASMPVFQEPGKMQWFLGQTLAFAKDHGIDSSNVEMPRVN